MTDTVKFEFDVPASPLEQLLAEREVTGGKMDACIEQLAALYAELTRLHKEIQGHLTGHAALWPPAFISDGNALSLLKTRLAAAFAPVSRGGASESPFGPVAAGDRLPLSEVFQKQAATLIGAKGE